MTSAPVATSTSRIKCPSGDGPKMMQVQDEEPAPEPRDDFLLGLRLEAIKGYLCVVSFGA